LEEALLLQMNDFDRFLEAELRRYLDPVAARRPPARKGRPERSDRPVAITRPAEQPAAEALPVRVVVEPAL
jgi:hypothetical protein